MMMEVKLKNLFNWFPDKKLGKKVSFQHQVKEHLNQLENKVEKIYYIENFNTSNILVNKYKKILFIFQILSQYILLVIHSKLLLNIILE